MARYNEILVGRFNRYLQKLLQMKGGPPAPQLASDIQASLSFSTTGADTRYLESWNRYAIAIQQAAVALNLSGIRLRNPLGSHVIAVFEKLSYPNQTATNNTVTASQGNTAAAADLGTIVAPGRSTLDPRGQLNPTLILSKQASAPTVPAVGTDNRFVCSATAGSTVENVFFDSQEITLLPGESFQVALTVINVTLDFVFYWRERFLEESERT